jgi:ribosome-associated protein
MLKVASSNRNSEVTLLTITLPDSSAGAGAVVPTVADAAPAIPAPDVPAVLRAIVESLEDSKAEDIVTIDIAGRSSLADAMIIASGRSQRHVGAIADHLDKKLREIGVKQLRIEGMPNCDWVLVDAGDAMVHLFRPEVRSFYNLEKMWEEEIPTPKSVGRTIARGPQRS